MEVYSMMNFHDQAMNEAIRSRADAQDKQEKTDLQTKAQNKDDTSVKDSAIEGTMNIENTVKQQMDTQATSTKVERQVDIQASKETLGGTQTAQETGNLIDIIT